MPFFNMKRDTMDGGIENSVPYARILIAGVTSKYMVCILTSAPQVPHKRSTRSPLPKSVAKTALNTPRDPCTLRHSRRNPNIPWIRRSRTDLCHSFQPNTSTDHVGVAGTILDRKSTSNIALPFLPFQKSESRFDSKQIMPLLSGALYINTSQPPRHPRTRWRSFRKTWPQAHHCPAGAW
jgi:hypothetical protein